MALKDQALLKSKEEITASMERAAQKEEELKKSHKLQSQQYLAQLETLNSKISEL